MARLPSLHQKISDELIEAIGSDKFAVGSTLPTEHELARRFNVSRGTITVALGRLEELGLVYRRPRLGTQVVSRFPLRSDVSDSGVFQDWARYGTEYYLHVNQRGFAQLPPTSGLIDKRDAWLRLAGVREATTTRSPICVTSIYVHPDFAAVDQDVTARPARIFSLIEARFGLLIRRVDQELRAVTLDRASAALLQVDPDSLGLEIRRWYWGPANKLVEFTIDTHCAKQFTYRTTVYRGPTD